MSKFERESQRADRAYRLQTIWEPVLVGQEIVPFGSTYGGIVVHGIVESIDVYVCPRSTFLSLKIKTPEGKYVEWSLNLFRGKLELLGSTVFKEDVKSLHLRAKIEANKWRNKVR